MKHEHHLTRLTFRICSMCFCKRHALLLLCCTNSCVSASVPWQSRPSHSSAKVGAAEARRLAEMSPTHRGKACLDRRHSAGPGRHGGASSWRDALLMISMQLQKPRDLGHVRACDVDLKCPSEHAECKQIGLLFSGTNRRNFVQVVL